MARPRKYVDFDFGPLGALWVIGVVVAWFKPIKDHLEDQYFGEQNCEAVEDIVDTSRELCEHLVRLAGWCRVVGANSAAALGVADPDTLGRVMYDARNKELLHRILGYASIVTTKADAAENELLSYMYLRVRAVLSKHLHAREWPWPEECLCAAEELYGDAMSYEDRFLKKAGRQAGKKKTNRPSRTRQDLKMLKSMLGTKYAVIMARLIGYVPPVRGLDGQKSDRERLLDSLNRSDK